MDVSGNDTVKLSAAVIAAAVLLGGCAATYKRSDLSSTQAQLDRSRSVLIAMADDGSYGAQVYTGSGQATSLAVRAAFAKFAKSTFVAKLCQDVACLSSQPQPEARYYVVPEILHWEERATEWSGRSDRIEIKLSIYDDRSNEIAATIVSGKSKWATFGGDHPQDLLPEPLTEYVRSLY